ncbi:MAG: hypothetical protein AMS24_04970 [Chlamydiae bacterium SM23_39]|nr:MAG: hypothetical protein AMS24_04970 [Chlamydiae bacterium SM23_39]
MKGKILFLGTGASTGIPVIGCNCKVCRSKNKKNKRLRPSCLIKIKNKNLLIDVTPDFRSQALKYNIDHIDGVIITHMHYDHIGGIDDLRVFSLKDNKKILTLLEKATFEELKKRFDYLFKKKEKKTTLSAEFIFKKIEKEREKNIFSGIEIESILYFQKKTRVLGYKIGDLAYISDIKEYKKNIFHFLKDVNILILSALREDYSPVHFNLKEAITFAKKTKAKKIYFTHIAHEIDHNKISKKLPHNIFLAYDGQILEFNYEK